MIYKGITLEGFKIAEFGSHCQYWAVKETSTGLAVTRKQHDRPRRRKDALQEAIENIENFGVANTKKQIKKALEVAK